MLGLVGGVCRFLCFCRILLVLGFGSSLIEWLCRRGNSLLLLCCLLRIVLGIGFFGVRLCWQRVRLRVGLVCFGCGGVCVGLPIFRSGRGVSCLLGLGSRRLRGFGCGFVGKFFLGFLLCRVFGLFGLGGGWRRRICGWLCSEVVVVVFVFVFVLGVWGVFVGRRLGLFVLCLGLVCLLGFCGIGVVF